MDYSDRRKSHRRRMLQGGKIVYGRSALLIDCMIRDLSEEGARLKVASARDVPDNIRLFNSGDNTVIDAEVVWRSPREVGIRFNGKVSPISESDDPKIRNLRFHD
ncbi:PilZ domain-containing protein [Breoghania corrubedonensis]|uniref:PilZ domain-containing protein n=1 Tax=Breoghania corrubedonensis TaxID=665038 RepID=A0A2T5V9Q5_9HYPH|nr:PilZ domain-containing protein [Breoghania corrubedonensis]PTW60464.1 PilZ domain-containing protein [Breoghania corrubedonensis]